MPTETSKQDEMVKVCKDVTAHLTQLEKDIYAYVTPVQGQSHMADHVRVSLDRMTRLTAEMETMPGNLFATEPVPPPPPVDEKKGATAPNAKRH